MIKSVTVFNQKKGSIMNACGVVKAWRDHILKMYTNIYCCYNEHTHELLTTIKTHSQYSSLLCLHQLLLSSTSDNGNSSAFVLSSLCVLFIVSSSCISGWSTLCSLGADWIGITIFYGSGAVSFQSVSTETQLLSRCVAVDIFYTANDD
jgi:hypothetical protein